MKERIIGVSIARIIACFAIVLCHIFQYYGNDLAWWFNGGVNVFLVISGFLYAKKAYTFKSIKEWLSFSLIFYIKEFVKIFVPLWIHIIISAPFYYMRGTKIIDIIKLLFLKNNGISGFGYMWFFKYILICYLFLPFYYSLPRDKYKKIMVVIAFALLMMFSNGNFIWYICFVLGMIISYLWESKHFKYFSYLTCFFAGISILVCILYKIDRYNPNLILNIQKLLTGVSVFCLCLLFFTKETNHIKLQKVINYLDYNTYYIFLVHPLFLSGVLSVMKFFDYSIISILLFLCFTLLYSFALKILSEYVIKKFKITKKNINNT